MGRMALVKGLQRLVTKSVQLTGVIPDSHPTISFWTRKSNRFSLLWLTKAIKIFIVKFFCHHTCCNSINVTEAARIRFGSTLRL